MVMNNYHDERNASVIFIENTKLLWHWLENIRNIMCPTQQFVEMLLLQNKPWLVRYKKKKKSFVFLAQCRVW